MHSRESIPNVGRRAQGRKTVFLLQGSGVNGTGAATKPPHDAAAAAEQYLPQLRDPVAADAAAEKCENPAAFEGSVLNQPGHPYNHIIQRILHRHQMAYRQQLHHPESTIVYRDKKTGEDHIQPALDTEKNTVTNDQLYSDLHLNRRPRDRNHKPTNTEPHWTASKDRTRSKSEDNRRQRRRECKSKFQSGSSLECRSKFQSMSLLDLSGGCLTGRRQLVVNDNDALPERGGNLDTTRSEPGDMARLSRVSKKLDPVGSLDTTRSEPGDMVRLPRASRKPELDELLDYFWVYQGMGRQVLNLDMPRNALDSKQLFKKPVKLPPIGLPICTGRRPASIRPAEEKIHADGTGDLKKDPSERRAISEPACVTRSGLFVGATSYGSALDCRQGEDRSQSDADSSRTDLTVDGQTLERKSRAQLVGGSQGKTIKLVIKMPVLTQEMSCVDLLEND